MSEQDMTLKEMLTLMRNNGAGYMSIIARKKDETILYAFVVMEGELTQDALEAIENIYDEDVEIEQNAVEDDDTLWQAMNDMRPDPDE